MTNISRTRRSTCGKALVFAAACLAAAFLSPSALAQANPAPDLNPCSGGEEVTSFASDLVVLADGRLRVTEAVGYCFSEARHGIYRDLPYVYDMDDGTRVRTPLTDIRVTDAAGVPLPFTQQRNGVFLRLKVGDSGRTVTGFQQYRLSYVVSGALRYFDDHDEVYWNVTGHEWTAPLRRVTADVTMPEGAVAESTKCYTGPLGSAESECLNASVGNTASFAADGPLTVVVGFPKGHVAVLAPELVRWTDDLGRFWPFLLPLAAAALMFTLWKRHGRDPRGRGTIVVQYDPPDKLPPAMVGVIVDERAGAHDLSAMIVDLAVRGHLKIVETEHKGVLWDGKDYELVKVKEYADDKALRAHERSLLDFLFGARQSVSVAALKKDHSLNKEMGDIKGKLYEDCVTDAYFPSNPEKTRLKGVVAAAAGALVVAAALFALAPDNPFVVPAGVASAAVAAAFGWLMPRRTEKGVAAREHALGFREYLAKAEKYRLQWQESENVFEKFLPYAMVFGVADKWTSVFADLQRQPDWYEGRPGTVFNAMILHQAVSSLDRAVIGAMHSSPQQSSGGSGFSGHSGGGFGGGGGGSW